MSIDGNTATTVGAQLDAAALKRVKADIDALAVKVFLGEHAVPNFDKALHLVSPPCVLDPPIDGQLILVPEGKAEQWHRELEALGVRVTRWPKSTPCPACDGTGDHCADLSCEANCARCNGSGKAR